MLYFHPPPGSTFALQIMVKFIHAAAIALLSAAMLPSGQAVYSCTTECFEGPNTPFLVASAADADVLNALEFAQTAMQAVDANGENDSRYGVPLFSTAPEMLNNYPNAHDHIAFVRDYEILYVDHRICNIDCLIAGMTPLGVAMRTPHPSFPGSTHGTNIYSLPGLFWFPDDADNGFTNGVDECNVFAQALNDAVGIIAEEKGKKGKKDKSSRGPKSPKSSKGPKGKKGKKGRKGKKAGLLAPISSTFGITAGGTIALVGVLGLVALVATKTLGAKPVPETEGLLEYIVPEAVEL